ncbi:MAG: hypothetical protein K0U72_01650 [Gammaproteobacteria bacterium]|nr:hypothetical protein [Gammaproteobacteria bacterium]
MIDAIDQQLKDWVNSTVAGTDVLLSIPPAKVDRPTVSLNLYEMDSAVPSRRDGARPIELTLFYLVTTRAKTMLEAHSLLGELLIAALESPDFDVDVRPIPTETWLAFGIAPQPTFKIGMPLIKERVNQAPLISKPVEVQISPIKSMTGVVLSPGGAPIPQARVEIPGTSNVAYTDGRGEFRFHSTPTFLAKNKLRVVARGIEQVVTEPFNTDKPIVIRFQPQEKRHG